VLTFRVVVRSAEFIAQLSEELLINQQCSFYDFLMLQSVVVGFEKCWRKMLDTCNEYWLDADRSLMRRGIDEFSTFKNVVQSMK